MICPKCNEGNLHKISFNSNKKTAFLCDSCRTYWFEEEHMSFSTGHVLAEHTRQHEVPAEFNYVEKEDADEQEVVDIKERVSYETS